MTERNVHFVESSPQDNPIKFEIVPLPDQEYLRGFYEVIKQNPHDSFGTVEIKSDGTSFEALVWDRKYTLRDDDDSAMKVANNVYDLQEHSEHHWRNILAANDITNPFTFKDLAGKQIKVPAVIPPEIIQGYVSDWVEKTNER